MNIIERPSPNCDNRGRSIDMIILHYTGMVSAEAALERLCDSEAKVSAHYCIDESGAVFQLVDEAKRAWHAGVGSWKGESDINARSIGIEIVNPGHEHGYRDFPEIQIDAVLALVGAIAGRHGIAAQMVLGHSDIAPRRKEDPGEKFPWDRLAENGLAVGPFAGADDPHIAYEDALRALSAIGYDGPPGDHAAALLAFQRRFCPSALGQGFDQRTKSALIAIEKEMA